MAVSSINQGVYSAYSYQWSQQQLQGAVANNSTGNKSGTSTSTTYNGISTVSSMVELARYAMDAMGVGKNERVTFSQIQTYKSDLEKKFDEALKKQMTGLGVASDAAFNVSVTEDGKLLIDSSHPDKDKIQKYFDANPDIGKKIRDDLTKSGVPSTTSVRFNVDATGNMQLVSAKQSSLQEYFNKNAAFGSDLLKGLKDAEIDITKAFNISTDEFGTLTVDSSHPDAAKIQKYIDEHPEVAQDLQKILEKQGIEEGAECTLTIGTKGEVTAKVNAEIEQEKAITDYLKGNSVAYNLKKGLSSVGIDPNVDFRLSMDENGKVKVISSHPDAAKIQKLFDDNPDLTKQYKQIDALAGLDATRKTMQVDPTAMKRRIEIESMAAWWGSSGNSSIGSFSGSSLSMMSGLNTLI